MSSCKRSRPAASGKSSTSCGPPSTGSRSSASMSRAEREVRALRDRLASEASAPEADLAIRLARLQGAAAGVGGAAALMIPDAVLRTWLADPQAFASWLGLSLLPHQ